MSDAETSGTPKKMLKFPDCGHFWMDFDQHKLCGNCRVKLGRVRCSRLQRCSYCRDWPSEFWDRQEKAIKANAKRKQKKSAVEDTVELHPSEDDSSFEEERPKKKLRSVARKVSTTTSRASPDPWDSRDHRRSESSSPARSSAHSSPRVNGTGLSGSKAPSPHGSASVATARPAQAATGVEQLDGGGCRSGAKPVKTGTSCPPTGSVGSGAMVPASGAVPLGSSSPASHTEGVSGSAPANVVVGGHGSADSDPTTGDSTIVSTMLQQSGDLSVSQSVMGWHGTEQMGPSVDVETGGHSPLTAPFTDRLMDAHPGAGKGHGSRQGLSPAAGVSDIGAPYQASGSPGAGVTPTHVPVLSTPVRSDHGRGSPVPIDSVVRCQPGPSGLGTPQGSPVPAGVMGSPQFGTQYYILQDSVQQVPQTQSSAFSTEQMGQLFTLMRSCFGPAFPSQASTGVPPSQASAGVPPPQASTGVPPSTVPSPAVITNQPQTTGDLVSMADPSTPSRQESFHEESDSETAEESAPEKKVSEAAYERFRRAVRASKGNFAVEEQDESTGTAIQLEDSKETPERLVWGTQQAVRDALNLCARKAQGVSSSSEIVDTPLLDLAAPPSKLMMMILFSSKWTGPRKA